MSRVTGSRNTKRLRVVKALAMLETGRSVEAIALDLGYSGASAFIAMFRSIPLTPSRGPSRGPFILLILCFSLLNLTPHREGMLARREHGTRTRSTWRLAVFLLVLVAALGAHAEPPSSTLPGRKPDSREPWGAFLGRAAHKAIGIEYRVRHPARVFFLNTANLSRIVKEGKLGDPGRLSELVRLLRPDITDASARVLFEVKPDDEESRGEAREQAGRYLAALNRAVDPDKKLVGGTGFEGSLFLEFENGGALWALSWRTPEPGVTLYRWGYRRKKPHASWKERAAQNEEAFPRVEIAQRGELAEQAIRAAYEGVNAPRASKARSTCLRTAIERVGGASA